ncbi:hypothetical protein H920_16741 [Fukomys damarensis]|uniref:Uncharacterized protein n=1 Tax=Fukomys damarensis TaxID=885580 RepID=A0A091CTU8_FUKDA|nr:hypothetical protein H920_16741 [Fukomys damarensis]
MRRGPGLLLRPDLRYPAQPPLVGENRLQASDDSHRPTDLRRVLRNYLRTGLLRSAWRFVRHLELRPSFGGSSSTGESNTEQWISAEPARSL